MTDKNRDFDEYGDSSEYYHIDPYPQEDAETPPEQPELSMGRYARMRKKFLKEHHKVRYYNLLTSCALNEHLNDTERRANEMEQMLTEQMAASEGVTENLKATDMMSWVRKMNSIRSRVQEIVMAEVIFA